MFSVNLRHLRVFNMVAATGGVRRSAEALCRSASSVSRSIRVLEQDLDIKLFERDGDGMLLTDAGEVVRRRAEIVEAELRKVRNDAIRLAACRDGLVGNIDAFYNENRLQIAVLLAEVHHMPSVACVMGISQSAISQAIAKLENALGQELFYRRSQGMIVSDLGGKWIARFKSALAQLNDIVEDIDASSRVPNAK